MWKVIRDIIVIKILGRIFGRHQENRPAHR